MANRQAEVPKKGSEIVKWGKRALYLIAGLTALNYLAPNVFASLSGQARSAIGGMQRLFPNLRTPSQAARKTSHQASILNRAKGTANDVHYQRGGKFHIDAEMQKKFASDARTERIRQFGQS